MEEEEVQREGVEEVEGADEVKEGRLAGKNDE